LCVRVRTYIYPQTSFRIAYLLFARARVRVFVHDTHARTHGHIRGCYARHARTRTRARPLERECARTHARTHAHTHARTHARTHLEMVAPADTHLDECARTHTPGRARTHTRTHRRTHARTHTGVMRGTKEVGLKQIADAAVDISGTQVCVCVCVRVRVRVYDMFLSYNKIDCRRRRRYLWLSLSLSLSLSPPFHSPLPTPPRATRWSTPSCWTGSARRPS
jgi:hypothetical protein